MMHSFFASVPVEIEEAAMLDGASPAADAARITLPLVWPGW